ncbi:MAG: autotransporter domain-containing protein [Rhizobiales bacterium]|nr:autotransporter domain-containing protein [Hyphomicrobiales bacterium]
MLNAGKRAGALVAALLGATAFAPAAMAQTFIWGGGGSTTTTSDFSLPTNWSGGATPHSGAAIEFGATGSQAVTLPAGHVSFPSTLTFAANAQSFTMSGGTIDWFYSGGGIINNANAGQVITISTDMVDLSSGASLTQSGNSTLILAGQIQMFGAHTVSAGSLVVASGGSFSGGFQLLNAGNFELRSGGYAEFQTKLINSGTVTIQGTYRSNDIRNDGTVIISGGADVYLRNYFVTGESANNVNSLTVTGAGTRLRMFDDIIASTAAGSRSTITISAGGSLENSNNRIGAEADTTATMLVTGAGTTWKSFGYSYIGDGGTGSVTIADGASARLGFMGIGNAAGSSGHVTVTGTGSSLTASSSYVGYSGNGTLTVSDGGYLKVPRLYLGLNAGSSGTLNIGAASGEAAVAPGTLDVSSIYVGYPEGAGTVVFNHTAGNYALNATIYGFGNAVLKFQSGTTNLNGIIDGSVAASILGGRANFNGTATYTDVTVGAGGTLGGSGWIGSAGLSSGAIYAGRLTTTGDFTMSAGATYRFTGDGQTTVGGTATLGGANLWFRSSGFADRTTTVLTAAGGVSGTFTLTPETGSFGRVVYHPNDVQLTINGYRAVAALLGTGSGNAGHVAAGLDRGIDASGRAPPAAFNPLLGLYGAPLAAALNRLSGEAGTGVPSTALAGASTFLDIMLDPMAGARGAMAAAPGSSLIEMADTAAARTPAERAGAAWSIWTKAYGAAGRTASDAATGAAGSASALYGVAAGADKLVSPGTLVGFALAGGGTSFGLGTRGSGAGDFAQIGLYASTRLGSAYVSAALAYGWNRFDVNRTVDALGVNEIYRSSPIAHTFGGRAEAGRRFAIGRAGLTPYVAVEAIAYGMPGYRETFAAPATGAFALAYAGRTVATFRGEAGMRGDAVVAWAAHYSVHVFGRLAYAGQTSTQRAAEASFQQLANSGFTVFGARASNHTALGTVGIETRLRQGTRLSGSLDGELGDRHRSLRANLLLSQSW